MRYPSSTDGDMRGFRGRGPGRHGRGTADDGRGGREGRGRGGPRGRRGGWQTADLPSADDAGAWFDGRLPADWFGEVTVSVDREEIVVLGELADDDVPDGAAGAEGRISRFRSDTRPERIEIALEAEARYGRKVSWGVRLGDTEELFTHVSAPVMTRLRQPERQVLDTLVAAGVARSRSDALAWCVRLVGQHSDDWLGKLREAMSDVDRLRAEGPDA